MKKETKRYSLVEYCGTRQRVYDSLEEYNNLLNIIEQNNRKKTTKYYFGNVTCVKSPEGKYIATIHLYNRLTLPKTITELDNETRDLTPKELAIKYQDKLKTKKECTPDINISYFENKNSGEKEDIHYDRRIKYIPVLYKDDEKYLNPTYIKACLSCHAKNNDYDFFKGLANEFCIYHIVSEFTEDIWDAVDKVRYQGRDNFDMYRSALNLYNNLILERKPDASAIRDENGNYQISRRRQRDFGFYIRDYNIPPAKRKTPIKYNYNIPDNKEEEKPLEEEKSINEEYVQ